MKNCPQCSLAMPDEAKDCPNCGLKAGHAGRLKPCKGCGRQCDPSAQTCPACGRPHPTGSSTTRLIAAIGVLTIMGVSGVVCVSVCSDVGKAVTTASTPASMEPAQGPPIEITAMDLWQRYQANEAAADNEFRGKTLHVRGVVSSIDKDFMNHVILQLRTPNQFMLVHAQLDSESGRRAASLSKRDSVALSCKGGPMILGSPTLDDCTLY